MSNPADRRKKTRTAIEDVTVEIQNAADSRNHVVEICPIINISESGMLFETSNRYTPTQPLRLTFVLPNSIIIIRTDVCVVHSFKSGPFAHVGVRFGKQGSPERNAIITYVRTHPPL
jgi:hypothetical protein